MRRVSDQQARQILAVLVSEGKVRERDARLALARYRKRVEQLRAQGYLLEAVVRWRPHRHPSESGIVHDRHGIASHLQDADPALLTRLRKARYRPQQVDGILPDTCPPVAHHASIEENAEWIVPGRGQP